MSYGHFKKRPLSGTGADFPLSDNMTFVSSLCMPYKNDRYSLRIAPEEREKLEKVAASAGYKSLAAFMLAASREKARLIRDDDVLTAMEERIAATFGQVMRSLSTINDGVQINVAQVSKLAQAFFTCVPAPPPESTDAAIAQAKQRFKRWERLIAAEREAAMGLPQ